MIYCYNDSRGTQEIILEEVASKKRNRVFYCIYTRDQYSIKKLIFMAVDRQTAIDYYNAYIVKLGS